jgi:HEPN domain-containing protein
VVLFSAQQAAEKAVKAVFLYLHGEGWGHSESRLLRELDEKTAVGQDILDAAKALDKHYIPARYPNGFASGMPGDYYTKKDAQEAIANAEQIIRLCEGLLRRQR